jgi:hypothetical protein
MHRALILAACLILLVSGARVHAIDVYRCSGTSFQDKPCSNQQTQRIVHLPDVPVQTSPPVPAPTDDTTASTTQPVAPTQAPPRAPPPAFYLCARYDGSVYLSEDGVPGRNAVPLGALGIPGRSLAEAPGLPPVPHIPASQAPFAGSYMWIDDACHPAGPSEACAYLRGELDKVESKLRRAFSDDEAPLQQEENSLRGRLRGC